MLTKDLRDLADFLDAHPNLERPYKPEFNIYSIVGGENLESASRIAKELGSFDKQVEGSLFKIAKTFGEVTLRYVFYRDYVCTSRVVGTEEVDVPAQPAKEAVKARTTNIDIIEWDCPSLLGAPAND